MKPRDILNWVATLVLSLALAIGTTQVPAFVPLALALCIIYALMGVVNFIASAYNLHSAQEVLERFRQDAAENWAQRQLHRKHDPLWYHAIDAVVDVSIVLIFAFNDLAALAALYGVATVLGWWTIRLTTVLFEIRDRILAPAD